jgi:hypothetical protein
LRTTDASAPFTTTMRVINRVHGHATYMRFATQVPNATSFSVFNVLMIGIGNLSDGCTTCRAEDANFTRRKPDVCALAFFSNQLG